MGFKDSFQGEERTAIWKICIAKMVIFIFQVKNNK